METKKQLSNIVLTGFSATGKSLVAREVARRLRRDFIDTDDEIVKLAGKAIADIFQQEGESKFRELERQVIKQACQRRQIVIATGGGAIIDHRNYKMLAQKGFIFCLEARPETIQRRLVHKMDYGTGPVIRPLLSGDNPVGRIRDIKAARQPYSASVDWTIHTDNLSIGQVAEEVVNGWRLLCSVAGTGKAGGKLDKDAACRVITPVQSYPVFVGYGLLKGLGERMSESGLSGAVTIISDETVFSLYGSRVEGILKGAGFAVDSVVVPPGEKSKSIDSIASIYDFLVEHRVERGDTIVALGGGMVGDLAGFAAATFLRGLRWVQVPTSLMAMVDASIGGKVGINHPSGKNLIGAFYQPDFVMADYETLNTLPWRELTSGWAEVVKCGLILDAGFFEFLEASVDKLVKLEPGVVGEAIARSAAIKAQVVSQDEREQGKRTLLNYGHTIAHGLETVTRYRRFLHGEAVAIGMMGAARLSQELGILSAEAVERQRALLQQFGLPHDYPCRQRELVAELGRAMELDKKVREKAIRWVLLEDIGRATIRSDVLWQNVESVLRELLGQ